MSRGMLLLVIGAVLISFSPVFVKVAALEGLGPTSIAFWRLLLGAIPLFLVAGLRHTPLRITRRVFALALLAGAVFTLDLSLWHRAIHLVGAGMATILGNTQVFNTALLAWLIFREKPLRSFYLAAVLGLVGVSLLVGLGGGIALTGPYLVGIIFGLATGVAYACYLMVTRSLAKASERPPLLTLVAWITLLGAACSLVVCLTESDPFLPRSAETWLSLVGLGILVQAAGWWIITAGLPQVKGSTAGLLLLLQPVLATIWGRLLFGETLALQQLAGGVITLGAIYLGTRSRSSRS